MTGIHQRATKRPAFGKLFNIMTWLRIQQKPEQFHSCKIIVLFCSVWYSENRSHESISRGPDWRTSLLWRIMGAMASQITSLTIVYSIVNSGKDQRKHQSSASLAFVRGIHRWPLNSPQKWPVTRKMFPSDDVIMYRMNWNCYSRLYHVWQIQTSYRPTHGVTRTCHAIKMLPPLPIIIPHQHHSGQGVGRLVHVPSECWEVTYKVAGSE